MGLLSWLCLGLVAGILAKVLMPGRQGGGFLLTTLLGVAGAFVGGFLGSLVGVGSPSGFNLGSLAIATLGALVLLWAHARLRSS